MRRFKEIFESIGIRKLIILERNITCYIIREIQRNCVCLYKLSLDLKKKLVYLFCLIEVYFVEMNP